jgi:cell shape-determining protein MreC
MIKMTNVPTSAVVLVCGRESARRSRSRHQEEMTKVEQDVKALEACNDELSDHLRKLEALEEELKPLRQQLVMNEISYIFLATYCNKQFIQFMPASRQ